jgi:hypothetical protein
MPAPEKSPPLLAPTRRWTGWSRWLALVVCTALATLVYGLYSGAIMVPERYSPYNPWAPLEVAAKPNWLTPYKLSRARSDPALCLAALEQTGMQYDLLPDRVTGPGCGFENAVRLRSAGVRFGAPLSLSCPMALSFAMWERHALQPAAEQHFGERVVAIEHLGSYACRNINTGEGLTLNGPARNRSRHATADALDIAGLTLASSKRITVLGNFDRKDATGHRSAEAALLDDLHAGACKYFKGVLGPDYNALHRDHFHLETGGYGMCR